MSILQIDDFEKAAGKEKSKEDLDQENKYVFKIGKIQQFENNIENLTSSSNKNIVNPL